MSSTVIGNARGGGYYRGAKAHSRIWASGRVPIFRGLCLFDGETMKPGSNCRRSVPLPNLGKWNGIRAIVETAVQLF